MKSKADEAKGKLEELKNAGNQSLDLNFNSDSTDLEDLHSTFNVQNLILINSKIQMVRLI